MKASAEDLEWAQIKDDFEGIDDNDDGFFYGLEEIDGYDVDKSEGVLKFVKKDSKPKQGTKQQSEPKKQASKPKKNSQKPAKETQPPQENNFSLIKEAPEPRALVTSLNDWPALSPVLYTALAELGFKNPTEIQKQSIPGAATGQDIIGKASTGSGKTLAFGLPIIDSFIQDSGRDPKVPQALVIAPTRELAHQIGDHLNAIISKCDFENTCGCVTITGGLSYQKQQRLMERDPIVVVGTPGRLFDVLDKMTGQQLANYQKIPTLVFDEADRLVQNNSFEDIDNIFAKLGRQKRQTMVFSATFQPEYWAKLNSHRKVKNTKDIREVLETQLFLRKNALFIDADPTDAVASAIVQSIMECPGQEKDLYLYYFTLIYPGKSIVFVNSIDAVKRITPLLKEMGMSAFGVHSDMVQKQRLRAIERFRDTPNATLIATDVAARGLDVPAVDHVVHYNLPRTADMYVHRSGRTARAGKQGVSLMLCSPEEASGALPKLCKLVKTKPVNFDVEYDVLDRLRERVILAKKIADSVNKATHEGKKKSWEQQAAEDLGIELSDTEQETKSERNLRAYRAELKRLLEQKIGPRMKYLTSGTTNLAKEMLKNPTAIVAGRAASSALESLGKRKKPQGQKQESKQAEEAKPAAKRAKQEQKVPEPKAPEPKMSKPLRKAEHKQARAKLLEKGESQVKPKAEEAQLKEAKPKDTKHKDTTTGQPKHKASKAAGKSAEKPSEAAKPKQAKKQNPIQKDKNGFVKVTHKLKAKGQKLSLGSMESVNKSEIAKQ